MLYDGRIPLPPLTHTYTHTHTYVNINTLLLLLIYLHQNGNTAFMWAAQYGKADIIKLLLKAGASVEAKNNVSKRVFIFTYVCVCVCMCV